VEQQNAVRRRGRTALIVVTAVVLGALAGGGIGYKVQYDRAPTPLPPLAGPPPAQPAGAGPAVAALPASQDRDAVFRGDLLALLPPTPKGAHQGKRDWMTVLGYAERFYEPERIFRDLVSHGYQRGVVATWTDESGTSTTIRLVQFRDDLSAWTPRQLFDETSRADDDYLLGASAPVPGTTDGKVWGSSGKSDAYYDNGGDEGDEFYGRGLARIGNIFVDVWVDGPQPVRRAAVMAVMKRQLERM
jgi:hypothetical protein